MSTKTYSRKRGSSQTAAKPSDGVPKTANKKSLASQTLEHILPPAKKLTSFKIPKVRTDLTDEDIPLSELSKSKTKNVSGMSEKIDLRTSEQNNSSKINEKTKTSKTSSSEKIQQNSSASTSRVTKKQASASQPGNRKSVSNDKTTKSQKANSQNPETLSLQTTESEPVPDATVKNSAIVKSTSKRKALVSTDNDAKQSSVVGTKDEGVCTTIEDTANSVTKKTARRKSAKTRAIDADDDKINESQANASLRKRRNQSANVERKTQMSDNSLKASARSVDEMSTQKLSATSRSMPKRKLNNDMSDKSKNETVMDSIEDESPITEETSKSNEKAQKRTKRIIREDIAPNAVDNQSPIDADLQTSTVKSETLNTVEGVDGSDKRVGEEKPAAKKKRGRPPKVRLVTPKAKRGKKSTGEDNSDGDEDDDESLMSCHHCDFTCSEVYWMKSHYAHAHILWYTKADPQGLDNPKSLRKIFTFLGGKVACTYCKKPIKTPTYYRTHVEWCKSDQSLMEKCDLCDKEYKAFWINEHKQSCLRKTAEKKAAAEALKAAKKAAETAAAESKVLSTGKRRAATKALSVIKNISNEKEEVDWNSMFSTPHMTVPSEQTLAMWQQCVDDGLPIVCAHDGCKVQALTIDLITTHYWTCPLNGLDCNTWNCKKCDKTFDSEKGALNHVQHKHSKAQKNRKRKLDEDFDADDQSHSEDDADSLSEVEEEEAPSGEEVEEEEEEKPRPSIGGRDSKAICQYVPVKQKVSRTKLCASLHCTTSTWLPELLPEEDSLTESQDSGETEAKSIRFRVEDNPEVLSLNKGQTIHHSSGYITYLGIPMKDVAWCPVSRDVESRALHGNQYLAVVPNNRKLEETRELCSFDNFIQIWKVANLTSHQDAVDIALNVILTHNFGYIYQMRWCYSGGYLPSTETNIGRLGLLALAASDGCVHIASVPLTNSSEESGLKKFYAIDKELRLSVPGNKSHCLCVDWQRMDNKFIFAGFSDGSVAQWYVGATLRSHDLHPVKVFRAHVSMVTAINCCPFHSDIFTTFSHGWLVWDTKNLTSPYLTPKTIIDWSLDLHFKTVWPRVYQLVIACTDPSFGTYPISLLSLGYDFFIANQKTPIRDVQIPTGLDICDCSDILVVCETDGFIRCHCPIVPVYVKGAEKGTGQRTITKWNALSTEEVDEDSCEQRMINFKYLKKEKEKFHGTISTGCDVKTLSENKRINSINSVSMNPNAAAHGWLLGGGEHGLLHLIKLSDMFPDQSVFTGQ